MKLRAMKLVTINTKNVITIFKTSTFNKSRDSYKRYFDHLPSIQNTETL